MDNKKKIICLSILFVIFLYAIKLYAYTDVKDANNKKCGDIILIDNLKAFGDIERAPAIFFHDAHTESVKDCATCHPFDKKKNRIVYKFKRIEDRNKEAVMDIYHDNCIDCHKESKQKAPLTCRECHPKKTPSVSAKKSHVMNDDIHSLHKDIYAEDCSICHHKGNKSCYECHTKEAFHVSCINCHIKDDAGPVKCQECHNK